MKYSHELNIPVTNLFRDGFQRPDFSSSSLPHVPRVIDTDEMLSPELISFFNDLGITPSRCHIFELRPGGKSIIHKDGMKGVREPVWAINWILDGMTTDMSWYQLKPGFEDFQPIKRNAENKNNGGAGGEQYPLEVLDLVEHLEFRGPHLLNVEVPHSVVNNSHLSRWCLSVREGHGRPWADIVRDLSSIIKDPE